jgi:hypothetical protein
MSQAMKGTEVVCEYTVHDQEIAGVGACFVLYSPSSNKLFCSAVAA